ncbi:MAG: BACON domain-containing carbohydrate-binding protein [Bryobacteraceae bacterium]
MNITSNLRILERFRSYVIVLALILPGRCLWGQGCSYTVAPTAVQAPAGETVGTIDIRAQPTSCTWASVSNTSWITISFGGVPGNPSTGNGTTGYRIQANRDAAPRTGTLTVAGQTVRITQAGANCPLTLTPAAIVASPAGASGSFRVQTTCNWTASPQDEWIRVTTGQSGTGNGSVFYTVAANNTGAPRSGAIRVGSTLFAVSQAATNCAVTLDPPLVNVAAAGGNGTVRVNANCTWMAESQTPWIRITGSSTGAANGQVAFTADANNSLQSRSGIVQIGNQTLTVVQAAATCVIGVNPEIVNLPAAGGDASIAVTSTCAWTASAVDGWIRVLTGLTGNGNGTVTIGAGANTGDARSGAVRIGTQSVAVRQAGGACQITLSPSSGDVASRGGGGTVLVAGGSDCSWSVAAPDWIEVTPGAGTGGAVLRYTAQANLTGAARTGLIAVAGQSYTVRQAAAAPAFTAAGVVNAASFTAGAVSPGLIVTIFGTELGPDEIALAELNESGTGLATAIGGTRVLFDGVASPVIYAVEGQVSVVVPFEVPVGGTSTMTIEARGARSRGLAIPVMAASPGLFTLAQSGVGAAAVRNQDNTVNTGLNPAEAGSVVQIFATGGGLMDPQPETGELVQGIARLTLPVTVEIGGRPAEVLYAGAAPGLVGGVVQVNARVPAETLSGGAVPLVVRIGEFPSQAAVTIAVR